MTTTYQDNNGIQTAEFTADGGEREADRLWLSGRDWNTISAHLSDMGVADEEISALSSIYAAHELFCPLCGARRAPVTQVGVVFGYVCPSCEPEQYSVVTGESQ